MATLSSSSRWKKSLARYIWRRYFRWRMGDLCDASQTLIEIDYSYRPKPRYGYDGAAHPKLQAVFEKNRASIAGLIVCILQQMPRLIAIANDKDADAATPTFRNVYFPILDAAALYTMLATHHPRVLIEVGSGNSTKFARRAIRDHGLKTKIISLDPQPRVEIEALCDQSIRRSLEEADLSIFDAVGEGDFVFIDNSHRAFMNSDVTVFFLEILPRLKKGVIIHIHDIFLPIDYPSEFAERYYNEQYLLACCLLWGAPMEILFSSAFAMGDPQFLSQLAPLWNEPALREAKEFIGPHISGLAGCSFWARLGPPKE